MRLVIVSGLSGSGKSAALNTLEDCGYFCIDNLPLSLLRGFIDELLHRNEGWELAAVGIDARGGVTHLPKFPALLEEIRALGIPVDLLYLHATTEVLLKRYSETRRRHPLSGNEVPLAEAIKLEQELLQPIAMAATLTIETNETNIHQLRDLVRQRVAGVRHGSLSLLFQSFGFKYGVPTDTDFIFDVRTLPNPHWEPQLRVLNGNDAPVIEYLQAHPLVNEMFDDICNFLEHWIPRFAEQDRSYLTTSIGCTGGQHRSVYIVRRLAEYFAKRYKAVAIRHRELK